MGRISFRSNVITGVLVLAPFGAVLGIIMWIWTFLMGLSRLIPDSFSPKVLLGVNNAVGAHLIDTAVMLLMLAVIILIVFAVGLVSRYYLGQRLVKAIADAIARVPVLRTVYSTLEQLLTTFASGQAKQFRRVVQVEYPRKGLTTLAFVTGERDGLLTIYVPTTPNPTSGFYLLVPPGDVKDAGMSVEQALKEIISMGIVHKDG